MTNYKNEINALGGITIQYNASDEERDTTIAFIKETMNVLPNDTILSFIADYGNSSFNKMVFGKTSNRTVFLTTGDIEIGLIFGYGSNKFGITKAIKTYYSPEQINQKFLPLYEGYLGDIIYYSLESNNFGKIFYWHHESEIGRDMTLLAHSFEEFFGTFFSVDEKERTENPLSNEELLMINEKRKKVGLPLIDKF